MDMEKIFFINGNFNHDAYDISGYAWRFQTH